MRVLWLSHLIPYPPKGGVLQRAYHLLHEVARYHEVDLVAFNQPELIRPLFSSLEAGIQEAKQTLGTFCRNVVFEQIVCEQQHFGKYRLALASLFSKDPYNINWLKSPELENQLQDLLIAKDYDLVHFDTISLIPYHTLVTNVPTVLDHHNIESHMLLRRASNENNLIKRWYFRQEGERLEAIEKQACPQFTLNITCSEIDRDRLKGISPGSRVEEVPNGVDVDYFKCDVAIEQEPILLFVGTLNWYPNIRAIRFIAYELWPRISALFPEIMFDVIGANPPDDIKQLGDRDARFRVHGFVDDVRPYFDKASVYVCPISDGGGTKLKVLDAFSMEKAVVAHPIACEGIDVQEGRNVIFGRTVDEYINAIQKLVEDKDLRHRLGKEARCLIEKKYAYSTIGKELSDLYVECVKSFHDKTLK